MADRTLDDINKAVRLLAQGKDPFTSSRTRNYAPLKTRLKKHRGSRRRKSVARR